MIRLIPLALLMLVFLSKSYGQITKGRIYIDGNLSFSKSSEDISGSSTSFAGVTNIPGTEENTNVSIGSGVNYFLTSKLAIGPLLRIDYSKTELEQRSSIPSVPTSGFTSIGSFANDYVTKLNTVSFGVQGTYFVEIKEKLFFTPNLTVLIGKGKEKFEQNLSENRTGLLGEDVSAEYRNEIETSSFDLGINPSLTYLVSDHIGVNLKFGQIGYGTETSENITESKSEEFTFDFDLTSLRLGLQYYF